MANFAYITQANNLIGRASLLASSYAASYPVTNLAVMPVAKPWRSGIGAHSQWVLMDFGYAVSVDIVALINHNFSSAATVTLSAGTTLACSSYTGSPAIAYRERDAFTLLSTQQTTYRYWKVAIADTGNLDGYLSIGYIIIGAYTQAAFNFAYGWDEVDEYESVEVESELGAPHVAELFYRKRLRLPFVNRTTAQATILQDLIHAQKRNAYPLFLIPDSAVNDGYFGRIVTNPAFSTPAHYSYRNVSLEFLEDSPGRVVITQPLLYAAGDDSIDDATFDRDSTAYQQDTGLLLTSKASDAVRDGHHPTLGTRTLLIEDTRTNGWSYPEDISNAAWTKTRTTVSANAATAPDGTATADKLVEDSTAGATHFLLREWPARTASTQQTASFYAKAGERTWLRIATVDAGNNTRLSYINLSTGALGTTDAGHTIHVITAGNSWYRIECSFDSSTGATTTVFEVDICTGNETYSYDGDGTSGIYLWGLMFEVDAAFASSYHATTRDDEKLYFTHSDVPQQSTIYVRFIERGTVQLTQGGVFYLGNAGATGARCFLYKPSSGSAYGIYLTDGTSSVSSFVAEVPAWGDTVELRATILGGGQVQCHQSINDAAETSGVQSGALALPAAWGDTRAYIGSLGTLNTGFAAFSEVKVLRGIQNRATCRAA